MKQFPRFALLALIMAFCLGDAPAPDAPDGNSSAWKKLYADEKWYQENKQPEQIFSGTLQRSAEPEVSITMRAHRYKLGDRFIYPGTENSDLESLVGQNVEIRGKASDKELEGKSISELLPAAIRVAGGATTKPDGRAIAFAIHDGYFVSNQFEPDQPESFLVIQNQTDFDKAFGIARVMHETNINRLPAKAFDSDLVLSAIKRGKSLVQYKVESVTIQDGVVTLSYSTQETKQDSAEFACPLIVSIPRGDYSAVWFEEDGKIVKSIELSGPTTKPG